MLSKKTLAKLEGLLRAGQMLANAAFKLKQRNHLTEAERRSLDESQRLWDEELMKLRR